MNERKYVQKIISESFEKTSLGRYRRRWEDDVKLGIKGTVYENGGCIYLTS
jgi:hypothetical protein